MNLIDDSSADIPSVQSTKSWRNFKRDFSTFNIYRSNCVFTVRGNLRSLVVRGRSVGNTTVTGRCTVITDRPVFARPTFGNTIGRPTVRRIAHNMSVGDPRVSRCVQWEYHRRVDLITINASFKCGCACVNFVPVSANAADQRAESTAVI